MSNNFKAKRELKHELQKTYLQIKSIINEQILSHTYLQQMETIYPHDSEKEKAIKKELQAQQERLEKKFIKYAHIKILFDIMDSTETLEQYGLDIEKYDSKLYKDKIVEIWITELKQTQPVNVSFFEKAREQFNLKLN